MSLFANLRRLWDWLPIIWADRDWDQVYTYRILAFKLRRVQRVFETDPYAPDGDSRDIQVCAHLMERLAEEDIADFGREQQHLTLFSKIFSRKSLRWWT